MPCGDSAERAENNRDYLRTLCGDWACTSESDLTGRLDGFEGKLTTSKWAKLAKCSQDTAYRDILDLVERGALRKDPGGGRSTSYSLAIDG
jgi:Fic family protein